MFWRTLATLKGAVGPAAFVALVAVPAAGQSTLADGTIVVVTNGGLFVVENQVTTVVMGATSFGGSLNAPTVTWIDGTNEFIVTTSQDAVGDPGGVFRVTLTPGGTGSVQNLTPSLPDWIASRFVDADYSPGLDILFLLQREAGQVVAWGKPATASLGTLAPWGTVPPVDARSIAVNGAKQPFAIAVALESGPVLRVDKLGTHELYATGGWNDITSQPFTGALIVAKQNGSIIGQIASASLLFDFNVSGLCGPVVPQPSDVEWDPIAGRAVAIASEAMAACSASLGATGTNHIVRLPLTAGGGPPGGNQPVLLTPTGDSGIVGTRADLALVRHGASEVTYWGWPGAGGGTSLPRFEHEGPLALGKTTQLDLVVGPPSAAALLVIGLSPSPVLFQGQHFLPAPQMLLPAVTSGAGKAHFDLKLSQGTPALVGREAYMQWVIEDTTTPATDDVASSQAIVFTIGVK